MRSSNVRVLFLLSIISECSLLFGCLLYVYREKLKALKMERDKLEQLVMVMKASRSELPAAPNVRFSCTITLVSDTVFVLGLLAVQCFNSIGCVQSVIHRQY